MPVKEYTVNFGGTPAGLLPPEAIAKLAMELNNPILHACIQMYNYGTCTWEQAMQHAAVELAILCAKKDSLLLDQYAPFLPSFFVKTP